MSILDTVAKTVLSVRVEGTNEAKAQLKSLGDTEKKIAQERIAGLEAGNKGLEKWIGVLGQVGVAIGVAKVAFDAFNDYAHKLDLESAAAGVSIDKLAKASHGLKTNMELLEHAAILNKTAFKLTQSQMETVETAMRSLESRGRNSSEVWNAMKTALQKGSIEPLENLGIVIDKTGLQLDENGLKLDTYGQKQQALERIMKALAGTAREVQDEQMNVADQTSQQIIRLQNLWDEAKLKLGELVADIGSKLLPVLASSIERAAKLISMLPGGQSQETKDFIFGGGILGKVDSTGKALDRFFGTESLNYGAGLRNAIAAYQAEQAARPLWATDPVAFGMSQASGEIDVGKFQGALTSLYEFGVKFDEYQKRKSGGPGASSIGQFAILGGTSAGTQGQGGGALGSLADTTYRDKYGAGIDLQSIIDQNNAERNKGLTDDWFARLNAQQSKKQKFLESTFGPIEDFNAYAQAFGMLTGAVSTGLNAWIDGSVSAGEAVKKFIGQALKGLASHMAVEALKHGAYAIGSLAFGDIAGASTHAAAAAAFTAGSVAAAVAAKEFGGGASAPKSAGGASGGGASAGGRSGGFGGGSNAKQQQQAIIYVVGESFATASPRERARYARDVMKAGGQSSTGTDS